MWNFIRPGFTHYILVSTAADLQGLLWPCSLANSFTAAFCVSLFYQGHEQLIQRSECDCLLCDSEPRSDWISRVCLQSFSYNFARFSYLKKKKGWSTVKNEQNVFLIRVPVHLGLWHRTLGKGSVDLVTQKLDVMVWVGHPSASVLSPGATGYRSSLRRGGCLLTLDLCFLIFLLPQHSLGAWHSPSNSS